MPERKKETRILSSGSRNDKPQKLGRERKKKEKKEKTNKKFSIKFPTNYSIQNVSCAVIQCAFNVEQFTLILTTAL